MIFPLFNRQGFSRNIRYKKAVFLITLSIFSTVCLIYHYASTTPNGHLIIISATYYNESSLYQNDTSAILFNADKSISLKQRWKCISINQAGDTLITHTRPRQAYRPIRECQMTLFIATCPTVPNPISLQLAAGDTAANLPLRLPVKERLPVVACFSPLFFNERWQLAAISIESYALAGVSRQAYYIMSAVKGVYDILQVYESERLVDLHYWALPRHPNARLQLDWRNQAAAHADCFLKYREAADFIIVSDIDDFLYPRQGADLFAELELMTSVRPDIASFFYPRFESEIVAVRSFVNFDMGKSLRSIKISNKYQTGKSIHRTPLVECPWIHWADLKKNDAPYHKLDAADNAFVHARNWTLVDKYDDVRLINSRVYGYQKHPYYPELGSIVPNNFITFLHNRFHRRFSNHPNLQNLTSSEIYYDKINDCYKGMLKQVARYNRMPLLETLICPTPSRCTNIDSVPGLVCAVATATYKTVQLADNFFVDYLISRHSVEMSENGCVIN